MSKLLPATCIGGIVTAEGVPVPVADILSEGVGASEGVLLLDEDEATYLTSNASDIKSALEKIASALGTVADSLTAIASQMLGPSTAPPPSIPSSVLAIQLAVTQLNTLKEVLK